MRVREARPDEFDALGRLLVDVYARLESFPGPQLQPRYYELLAGIGAFASKPQARLLVAPGADVPGGVVLRRLRALRFGRCSPHAHFRRHPPARRGAFRAGLGVGRALTEACISLARRSGHARVVLHTTRFLSCGAEQ